MSHQDNVIFSLLWQRDKDSKNFPLTELKRALRRFSMRRELRGIYPGGRR